MFQVLNGACSNVRPMSTKPTIAEFQIPPDILSFVNSIYDAVIILATQTIMHPDARLSDWEQVSSMKF